MGFITVRIRFIHAAAAALTVGLVAAAPASATVTPSSNAPTVASAMTDALVPGVLSGSSFPVIAAAPAKPAATIDSPLAGFPTSGSTYAILSSGDTTLADDPNTAPDSGATNGSGNGGHGDAVEDLVTLRLAISVPGSANCLSLDFRFLSEEFPEFVGQTVNDAFVAELDTSDFQGQGDAVTAPHNFAFDEAGNAISVNTAGFSAANASGTTYDGATSLLRASTPVTPGPHAVYLSVFDQGDSAYDSAALLDRVVLTNTPPNVCQTGSSSDTIPPETTITGGPGDGLSTGPNPSFTFVSSEPGSAFQCRLDGAPFATCSSPAGYADLANGSHVFSVRAFDTAGNPDPTPASRSFTVTGGRGDLPLPVAGEAVNIGVVSGTVRAQCKGDDGFRRIGAAEQLAVGCTVDATRGRVRLTSATDTPGVTQTADFYFGQFKIKQRTGETEVTLKLNGDLGCGKGSKSNAVAKRGRRRGGRGLWGDGDGRFTTRGHHGAGTVRGTKWIVGDRCDGSTYVKVTRGAVSFRDFVADKTVAVRAGHQYSTK